jgi:hypothetical protein
MIHLSLLKGMGMLIPVHRRHDISDSIWSLLEPHLPGRERTWGAGLMTIAALSVGEMEEFGKNFSNKSSIRPISSSS